MARSTHRIDCGEFSEDFAGEWVEIRERLPFGDRNRFDMAGITAGLNPATNDAELKDLDTVERLLTQMETAIVAWSFGFPVSRQTIDLELDGELGDWLIQQIAGYYARRRRSPAATKSAGEGNAPVAQGEAGSG